MKYLIRLLAFVAVFVAPFAHAEKGTIHSMAELDPLVDEGTLVVFDIDNTTLKPTQTLGSDQFFRYLKKKAEARGLKEEDAVAWALMQVTPIQPRSPVVPVEEMTPGKIREFQRRGIVLFALTARPMQWMQATIAQLRSIAVDFSVTAPSVPEMDSGIHFQRPGKEKGPDLVELIGHLERKPTKVVFVDDRQSNVDSVEKAMDTTDVPHFSLRYDAADAWVSSFDARVAELQWKTFRGEGRFMSDTEAMNVLSRACATSPVNGEIRRAERPAFSS